jgi:hypothetical protein
MKTLKSLTVPIFVNRGVIEIGVLWCSLAYVYKNKEQRKRRDIMVWREEERSEGMKRRRGLGSP